MTISSEKKNYIKPSCHGSVIMFWRYIAELLEGVCLNVYRNLVGGLDEKDVLYVTLFSYRIFWMITLYTNLNVFPFNNFCLKPNNYAIFQMKLTDSLIRFMKNLLSKRGL